MRAGEETQAARVDLECLINGKLHGEIGNAFFIAFVYIIAV